MWRARYRGPDRRERSKTFDRKIDAERWLTTQEADLVRHEWVDPDRGAVTVSAWAETWLAGRKHRLKPKTLAGYESLVRRWIEPAFGKVPIGEVQAWSVREWVASMSQRGLSASRVTQAVRLLSSMMRTAVRDRRIVANPCDNVDLPRSQRREMRFLDHVEVERLAEAAGVWRPLVLTLAYCGLRWGEAAALRRRDCDLLRRRLQVRESLAIVKGELVFGPTKTYAHRQVPVPEFLVEILTDHLGAREGGPDDLLFPSADGSPLRHGQWWHGVWLPAVKEAGLGKLRIHDLRHTCVALLIAQGEPAEAIRNHVGHSTIVTTFDSYGHLFPQHADRLADGLERGRADALAACTRPEPDRVVELPNRTGGVQGS